MNKNKKSIRKTAKNTDNRCLYLQTSEKYICQVYDISYKTTYFQNHLRKVFKFL